MAGKHFIIHGAICKCQFGSSPDKLVVSTQTREYINDNGEEKLIASTVDLGQPFEAKTFGACAKKKNNPCTPTVAQWLDFYPNVTLTHGGHILTEASKATCPIGAPGCITITFHGQTAAVTQAHFNKAEVAVMAVLNPLAPKPTARQKDLPQVKRLKATLTQRTDDKERYSSEESKEAGSAKAKKDKDEEDGGGDNSNIAVFTAGKDEPLQFDVTEYYNAAKADTSKVSWKIVSAHAWSGETDTFDEVGPQLSVNFDEYGQYRVAAYGSKDPDQQEDDHCCFDIDVKPNALKDEIKHNAANTRAAKLAGGGQTYYIRRGAPATLSAAYELAPTDADRQRVHMEVSEAAGGAVLHTTDKGQDTITFTPDNTAAAYIVSAIMGPDAGGEGEARASQTFRTEVDGVLKVTCRQGEWVRPGTQVTLEVTQLDYTSAGKAAPAELQAIRWKLNGRLLSATGGSLTLPQPNAPLPPGKYVIDAFVPSERAMAGHRSDDWKLKVAPNELTTLTGPAKWLIGKKYTLKAETALPYDSRLDGAIKWMAPGGHGVSRGTECTDVWTSGAGKGTVTASLGASAKTLGYTADAVTVDRWCFTDAAGVYKRELGWGETVTAVIRSPQAAGEKLHLHLAEHDSDTDLNYLADLGTVTLDAAGEAKATFKTDDLKPSLNNIYLEFGNYDIVLATEKRQDGLLISGMKETTAGGKTLLFPQRNNLKRGAEVVRITPLKNTVAILSVHYLDPARHEIYKVLSYGDPVQVHIQTQNLVGQELECQLWENRNQQEDRQVDHKNFKVGPDGAVDITLNTAMYKTGNAAADAGLRMFYMVLLHPATDRYLYPEKIADNQAFDPRKVYFYHHLKFSTTALLNKLLSAVAPVVLGEPLENPVNKPAECYCYKDFTVDEVKKMVKLISGSAQIWQRRSCTITDKSFESLTRELNATFKKYDINICIRKIHFLSQVMEETWNFGTAEEEPSRYASSRSIYKGRGLIQLTGNKNNVTLMYDEPGAYKQYADYTGKTQIVSEPGLVASDISLSVDSGGWEWSVAKKCPMWKDITTGAHRDSAETMARKEYLRTKYKDILGKTPNEIADYVDKYQKEIGKLINGFHDERDPINQPVRRKNYVLLRDTFFKYRKLCKNKKVSDDEIPLENGVQVLFDAGTKPEMVSQKSINIIKRIGKSSNNLIVHVSSTARTPREQAEIMYSQCSSLGVNAQKRLYASAGDKVIDVYSLEKANHKTEAEITDAMEKKINELGPSSVSRHCGDQTVLNVFDISSRRLEHASAFLSEAQKLVSSEISKIINETDRNCYHFEIDQ